MSEIMPISDSELSRYARQILLDNWDIDAQQNLKNSHVLIIGMGGLGCPVVETLVRAGVGNLTLMDNDAIDDSNLQRQTLFTPDDIGQSKVFTAKNCLASINELVTIEAINERFTFTLGEQIINQNSLSNLKFDLILDCTDNFATRDSINQFSVTFQIPLLTASAIGYEGQLALFEPVRHTSCYHCLFQHDLENHDTHERRCIDTGVLASTTAIMGNLQANAGLFFLGKKVNNLAQTLLLWDGQRMNLRKIKFQADPNCTVCGK